MNKHSKFNTDARFAHITSEIIAILQKGGDPAAPSDAGLPCTAWPYDVHLAGVAP